MSRGLLEKNSVNQLRLRERSRWLGLLLDNSWTAILPPLLALLWLSEIVKVSQIGRSDDWSITVLPQTGALLLIAAMALRKASRANLLGFSLFSLAILSFFTISTLFGTPIRDGFRVSFVVLIHFFAFFVILKRPRLTVTETSATISLRGIAVLLIFLILSTWASLASVIPSLFPEGASCLRPTAGSNSPQLLSRYGLYLGLISIGLSPLGAKNKLADRVLSIATGTALAVIFLSTWRATQLVAVPMFLFAFLSAFPRSEARRLIRVTTTAALVAVAFSLIGIALASLPQSTACNPVLMTGQIGAIVTQSLPVRDDFAQCRERITSASVGEGCPKLQYLPLNTYAVRGRAALWDRAIGEILARNAMQRTWGAMRENTNPHNDFLILFLAFGVIGTIPWALFVATVVAIGWQCRGVRHRIYLAALLGISAGLAMLDSFLWLPQIAILLLCLSLVASAYTQVVDKG